MGLADLKKNSTQSNTAREMQLSLDAFIDEASLYAMGLSSAQTANNVVDMSAHLKIAQPVTAKVIRKGHEPFRKATFTLSESAIAHLAELASDCDVAKSKLIRFLIEHHYTLPIAQRKQQEQRLTVE